MNDPLPQSELSRRLDVSDLPAEGLSRALRATTKECRALCRRFDLERLQALAAEIHIANARGAEGELVLRVKAEIYAEVTQVCVVTLRPFQTKVEEAFTILFRFAAGKEKDLSEDDFGYDMTEPLETSELDVGELVAQYLALALDPHPRAPGAEWQGPADGAEAENAVTLTDSPFAKLGQLKNKM